MACPRLSIDWGTAFPKPLLTPYEVTLGSENPWGRMGFILSSVLEGVLSGAALKLQRRHFLAVWPCASPFRSLNLTFPFYAMGIIGPSYVIVRTELNNPA